MVKQDVSRNFPGRPSARRLDLPRLPWGGSAAVWNVLSFVPKKILVLAYSDGGD